MPNTRLNRTTMAVVLAGGYGSRLGALTRWRCKPAVPFGARYRSIDFTLSNCVNSGLTRIAVATQYHAHSLIEHIQRSWWHFLNRERGEFVELWAAEQRDEARWYAGTADAVFQNLAGIERHDPRYVLVLAADHVYRMDYGAMLDFHRTSGAGVTVACQGVPAEQARHFGIMTVEDDEIVGFREKPLGIAGGDELLASMGVYLFDADLLSDLLHEDAASPAGKHDFGHDVIPACVRSARIRACAYPFRDPCTGGAGYWRDIGTIDAYWAANMELLARQSPLDPGDPDWPIWAPPDRAAPTRLMEQPGGQSTRVAEAIIAGGCRLDGASVYHSIVSGNVSVGVGSVIEDSILLPGARVGANCHVRRAIVDDGVALPDGSCVGVETMPSVRQMEVSPGGITVLSRWARPETGEPARGQRPPLGGSKRAEPVADRAARLDRLALTRGALQ